MLRAKLQCPIAQQTRDMLAAVAAAATQCRTQLPSLSGPPAGLCQRKEPCADLQSATYHCPEWGEKVASRQRCLQCASSIYDRLQACQIGPAIWRTMAARG